MTIRVVSHDLAFAGAYLPTYVVLYITILYIRLVNLTIEYKSK